MHALSLLLGVKQLCAMTDGTTTVEFTVSKCCDSEIPVGSVPNGSDSCESCTDILLPSNQSIRASMSTDVELGNLLASVVLVPFCLILPSFTANSPPWPVPGLDAIASAQVLDALSSIVIRC